MKSRLLHLIILPFALILTCQFAFSQVPKGFNYQTLVRNAAGAALSSQDVTFRITLTNGNGSITHYAENQIVTTTQFGIANLVVGNGTVQSGTYEAIPWSAGDIVMKVEIKLQGSSTFSDMGSLILRPVPYAMYALNNQPGPQGLTGPQGNGIVQTINNGDGTYTFKYTDNSEFTTSNLTGPLVSGTTGQTLRNNGTTWVANSILLNDGTNIGISTTPTQKLDVNGSIRLRASLFDNTPSAGALNQVLTSTGSGVLWKSPSSISLPTGTGTAGQLALWSNTNSLQGLTNLSWGPSLQVTSSTTGPDNPILEVRNNLNQVVFGVYQGGVRIYVEDGLISKGVRGGFAIGGLTNQAKAQAEYFRITPDSARIWVKEVPSGKGVRGGFAIGGLTNQGKATKSSQLIQLTPANYFIGYESGISMSTGVYNSFLGYQTGKFTQSGRENIFIGYQTGLNNIGGSWNTFLGYQAGMVNTGSDNTFIGYKAGNVHQSKGGNVYIGSKAGEFATNGQQNIFIGESAGSKTTDGHTNIFIGLKAGYTSEMTWGNIFIGNEAGYNTFGGSGIQGSYNTFIGWQSGLNNVIGSNNTFLGTLSGMSTTSDYNTMIGTESGWKNTTGGHNTFVGYRSGYNSTYALTTGSNNTFIGDESGYDNSTGYTNLFAGMYSGHGNTSGFENTFVGPYAGNGNSTGYRNIFVGHGSGSLNYGGTDNIAIGNSAGQGGTDNIGSQNVFIGGYSGWRTSTSVGGGQANRNAFFGYGTGYSNTTGANNTYIGGYSGYSNTSGNNNTYIGYSAGGNASAGNNNVFIGLYAGYSESGDNKLYIANGSGVPLIYGDFGSPKVGINTITPSEALEVNGKVKATAFIATFAAASFPYKYSTTLNMAVPDYVFEKHFEGESTDNPIYEMMNLSDLREFINKNRHLPRVPSRAEISNDGVINLQGMSMITLEKVEENTLYILELEKITKDQQKQIEELKEKNKDIDLLKAELEKIKEMLKK